MRQVVCTDVLIVGRLDVDGQSFAPISLHKMDAAPVAFRTNAVMFYEQPISDWLVIKHHCIGTKGLPGVQLQN